MKSNICYKLSPKYLSAWSPAEPHGLSIDSLLDHRCTKEHVHRSFFLTVVRLYHLCCSQQANSLLQKRFQMQKFFNWSILLATVSNLLNMCLINVDKHRCYIRMWVFFKQYLLHHWFLIVPLSGCCCSFLSVVFSAVQLNFCFCLLCIYATHKFSLLWNN